MKRRSRLLLAGWLALDIGSAACGRRGAPLPPIHLVPAPATVVTARRMGDQVELRFNVPFENSDHSTPAVISRVDIYGAAGPNVAAPPAPMSIPVAALSILFNGVLAPVNSTPFLLSRFTPVQLSEPAGFVKPAARSTKGPPPATTVPTLLVKKHLRGHVDVRPEPAPGVEGGAESAPAPINPESPEPAAPQTPVDPRPQPGWTTTFREKIATERTAAAHNPDLGVLRYVVVGVAGAKRLGAPSVIVEVPLTNDVAAPTDATASYDATTLTLSWKPGAPAQVFRVYESDAAGTEVGASLNPAPLTTTTLATPVTFDKERCFTVRAVIVRGSASVESDPAGPVCLKPVDTFPPPAPSGLSALPTENQVQLIWAPVTTADLAGYIVLRGEDGSTPAPLMTAPVTEARYADTTVRVGVHYTYVVVAVDKAGNRSLPSNQIDEIR